MAIIPKKFNEFLTLSNTTFTIPVYQRNYCWTEDHCKELFGNILNTGRNNKITTHFIGSIVYSMFEKTTNNEKQSKECVIIDGQQRVITIILIYIALYKLAKRMSEKNKKYTTIANEIFTSLFMNKFWTNNVKLKPSESYQEVLRYIVVTNEVVVTEDLKPFARIIRNYKYFTKMLREENFDFIKRGLDKLIFAEIVVDNEYVDYYTKLLSSTNETDEDIKSNLKTNIKLGTKFTYPFLMKVYYDYDHKVINKATFIEILSLLQTFVWRRFIVGLSTSGLSKVFMNLHSKIDKGNYLHSLQKTLIDNGFPTDAEITKALKTKDIYNFKPEYRSYLFEKLESYQNKEAISLNFDRANVEHIFPPKPAPKWKEKLSKEDYKEMKKYLNTIGNLTLSKNWGAMENLYFTEKRDMNSNGKEQGYKYSKLWLNSSLKKLNEWNKKTLEDRTREITERFLKVWKMPTNMKGISTAGKEEGIISKIFGKIFGK